MPGHARSIRAGHQSHQEEKMYLLREAARSFQATLLFTRQQQEARSTRAAFGNDARVLVGKTTCRAKPA